MKFKLAQSIIMAEHVQDEHIIDTLNEYFTGWIFIDNKDNTLTGLYNVEKYKVKNYDTDEFFFSYLHHGPFPFPYSKEKIENLEDVRIVNDPGDNAALYLSDIIFKLVKYDEKEQPGKVRWYHKGKLEKLTTKFEMFEAVRWYHKGKLEKEEEEENPDDFITDKSFKEFLIKNGAYEKYIRNCCDKSLKLTNQPYDFLNKFNEIIPRYYISHAFHWLASPEGRDYWVKLSEKWI